MKDRETPGSATSGGIPMELYLLTLDTVCASWLIARLVWILRANLMPGACRSMQSIHNAPY